MILRFIESAVRAYGSRDTQQRILGRTYPAEPVCVERLPEGGVYRVDCARSGVEVRQREHWGRKLGRAWKALTTSNKA
jgi:hypothetical protein